MPAISLTFQRDANFRSLDRFANAVERSLEIETASSTQIVLTTAKPGRVVIEGRDIGYISGVTDLGVLDTIADFPALAAIPISGTVDSLSFRVGGESLVALDGIALDLDALFALDLTSTRAVTRFVEQEFLSRKFIYNGPDQGEDLDFGFLGWTGDIRAWTHNGDDTLRLGSGNDMARGGKGDDTIKGGSGNDRLIGQAGDDDLSGGAGRDTLVGNAGRDALSGGRGNDTARGGGGADDLSGGAGRDRLNGNVGDDTIEGGRGSDTLTGGGGRDSFVFRARDGRDTITDFQLGRDTITITGDDTVTLRSTDTGLRIAYDGGTIRLADVMAEDATLSDILA